MHNQHVNNQHPSSSSLRNAQAQRSQTTARQPQAHLRQENHQSQVHSPIGHVAPESPPSTEQSERKFLQIKTHGGKAAFGLYPDETLSGWHTIRLEGAPKINLNSKAYNWQLKIAVQMTLAEMPYIIGVLLGFLPSCEYNNHGSSNKGFALINQNTNFFFKIYQPGEKSRMYVCPVPLNEAHLMGLLALSQYVKNFPGLTTDSAILAIRSLAAQALKNDVAPLAKPSPTR